MVRRVVPVVDVRQRADGECVRGGWAGWVKLCTYVQVFARTIVQCGVYVLLAYMYSVLRVVYGVYTVVWTASCVHCTAYSVLCDEYYVHTLLLWPWCEGMGGSRSEIEGDATTRHAIQRA